MKAEREGAKIVSYKEQSATNKVEELDFDELLSQFNELVKSKINSVTEEEFTKTWSKVIIDVTEKYLGKGQKVNQCSKEQVEALALIVEELKEIMK